jgi:RimJ/RimL family protein N-acetyltransferase
LEFITPELLHKGYHNTQLVIDEMKSERRDEFDFLDKSFGYCTIYDNEITSWCMSEYNTDQRFEIGIETHQDHRRKGLALQIARACINFGAEKGYTKVGWHCWKTNLPSNKLASSLGFKYVLEYPTEYLEIE